jgi:hypothetical protein
MTWSRVSNIPDRHPITDDGIRELLKKGQFINQIRHNHKTSLKRIQKIDRELREVPA